VVIEDGLGCLGFNIPQNAGGVTRRGDNLIILDESAAGQVALVLGEFTISLLLTRAFLAAGELVH